MQLPIIDDPNDMTQVCNWQRTALFSFMTVKGAKYWELEYQAYLNYIDSRIVLTKWDKNPVFYEKPEYMQICKDAYKSRLQFLDRINQNPSELRQRMIDYQVREVRMQVAEQIYKNDKQYDKKTIISL